MDPQFYNVQHPHYPYYPPPPPSSHQPQNPNSLPNHHEIPSTQIVQTSNTVLQPPGVDSYPVSLNSYHTPHVAYESQAAIAVTYGHPGVSQVDALPTANYYQDPAVSQSWATKEAIRQYVAAPIAYSPAIKPLNQNSIVPTGPNNSISHPLANDAITRIPKKSKVSQSMRCEICKIDCTSIDDLNQHILGKKHKKNLLVQEQLSKGPNFSAIASMVKNRRTTMKRCSSGKTGKRLGVRTTMGSSVVAAGEDLETKRQKLLEGGAAVDSVIVCTPCNVACNSLVVFNDHIAGKKHAAQVGLRLPDTVVPTGPIPSSWTNPLVRPPFNKAMKKGLKKPKIVQSVWCEVCNINCNSKDVLDNHKLGKKHKKKLEKLEESKKIANTPASTSTQIANNNAAIIGPQENPSSNNGNNVCTQKSRKKPASALEEEDLETKRQKIMNEGAATEAVRVCAICNVVCNSPTVFNFHLAGQKHANMVKRQSTTATPGPPQVVSAT